MRIELKGLALVGAILLLAACRGKHAAAEGRGAGLATANLSAPERAQIYAAALGASFDVGPSLELLVDPTALPRSGGYEPGPTLDADVMRAMQATRAFHGSCQPQAASGEHAPRCNATHAGYVVRVSEIFRRSGDTLQTYALAERFDIPTSGSHAPFHLAAAYQLVHRRDRWVVVKTGRVE